MKLHFTYYLNVKLTETEEKLLGLFCRQLFCSSEFINPGTELG